MLRSLLVTAITHGLRWWTWLVDEWRHSRACSAWWRDRPSTIDCPNADCYVRCRQAQSEYDRAHPPPWEGTGRRMWGPLVY